MKIAIIGVGYVGLPTGVGLAELGNVVVCVDKIKEKVERLNSGELTLYEDGIEELFKKNLKKRLSFTTEIGEAVKDADVVMIAVGTPPHPVTGEADLKYVYTAAKEIAPYINKYMVVANKSTVPVGTGDAVEEIIRKENPKADFDVVSLPEFLREGFAMHDFFNPDRIVLGTSSKRAIEVVQKLYKPFLKKTNFLCVNRKSSETIKYASNAFLAMKIHYINEMADFCEKCGANINEVAEGMGLDSRIGKKFLNAGPGYGGSCFPKDTHAMAFMGKKYGAKLSLVETTIIRNAARKVGMGKRVAASLKGDRNAKIAILGLAFKGGTDDCRDSPAMEILNEVLNHSDNVCVYDPKAMENAMLMLGDKVSFAGNVYDACEGADVAAILTEWDEFKKINLKKLKKIMRTPRIVDLRNMLKADDAIEAGFAYECVGCK